jgi:hypothetical protein
MSKERFTPRPLMVLAALAACSLCFASGLHAEMKDSPTPGTAKPFVTSVSSPGNSIRLEGEVNVYVSSIGQLLAEKQDKNREIILFINGLPLKEVYPAVDADGVKT